MTSRSKALFCALLLSALGCKTTNSHNQSQVATFVSPIRPTVTTPPVALPNTHQVDDRVYRGMLPINPALPNPFDPLTTDILATYDSSHQLLNNLQITDVLILDSRYNVDIINEMSTLSSKLNVTAAASYGAVDTSSEFATQEQNFRTQTWDQSVNNAPQNYYYRPLLWHNLTPFDNNCRQYIDALRVLQHVRNSPDRRVFFHCTVGEDRTGTVAALYDFLNNPSASLPQVFHDEMCEHGYEAGNPVKPMSVVSTIRANLTPFFLRMAYKIRKAAPELTWDNLNYDTCNTDPIADPAFKTPEYSPDNYQCQPSSLAPVPTTPRPS